MQMQMQVQIQMRFAKRDESVEEGQSLTLCFFSRVGRRCRTTPFKLLGAGASAGEHDGDQAVATAVLNMPLLLQYSGFRRLLPIYLCRLDQRQKIRVSKHCKTVNFSN